MTDAFETWFAKYHDDACREYGGLDCTNPKGIAEEAWDAALSAKTQADPVAWRVHPFDYGVGSPGVYATTHLPQQRDAWLRKGWTVHPLYATTPVSPKEQT